MSEPSWMPSDETIKAATLRWFQSGYNPDGSGESLEPIRALLRAAVEKALAEQKQEWIAALKTASGEYKCHPDFAEMWAKAESDPTYWAELLRSSRDAYREQEARHKREVLSAKIVELENYGQHDTFDRSGDMADHVKSCRYCIRNLALRAELAALDGKGKS